jgi:hypothetical protein
MPSAGFSEGPLAKKVGIAAGSGACVLFASRE